jgi:hypothetical protein
VTTASSAGFAGATIQGGCSKGAVEAPFDDLGACRTNPRSSAGSAGAIPGGRFGRRAKPPSELLGAISRVCATVLALLALASPAVARAQAFSIDRFAATIQINPDASLTVHEAITFEFVGRHHGIYRTIPIREFRGGHEWVLRIEDVHVFDEAHQSLRTEVSHPGHYVRIKAWVPGAYNTAKTVTIFYRVRRGLLTWNETDELYWNVTGTEWDVPIRSAEAFVAAPRAVPDNLVRSIAYTGPRGAAGNDYIEERIENFVTFRATRPLRPREGLTIVVAWPRGYIARPSAVKEARWFLADNWGFGLPFLTLALLFGAWRVYGRDPGAGRSIKPEYEPPPDLIPAEAGALVDERAQPRDVVSTLVDLAVRGYLQIEQVTTAFGDTDFMFKRLKPVVGDPTLKPLEVFVLARIFHDDWALNLRLLSEIKSDYDYSFPAIREEIYKTMVQDRLFPVSPELVRTIWIGVGMATVAAGLAVFLTQPEWLGPVAWTVSLGLAISGVIVALLARAMPRRTLRGAQTAVKVRGFQEFLERAEKDRLERMPPDTFHRFLPWAIALGVTDRWIVSFEGLKVSLPTWYTGRGPWDLGGFHRDFTSFSERVEAAILTTRRGSGDVWSGGSGSGGGSARGSSGGGRGGGGGGTF